MTTATTPATAELATMRADFDARWNAAIAKIHADWASLTARQRTATIGSVRIREIRAAYHAIQRPYHKPQISIARLGYPLTAARGYGPDAVLAHLARDVQITIYSDRMRQPGTVRKGHGQ